MEIVGLNKIVNALGNAFSVFDFSFFISGAVTLGFIALDLHGDGGTVPVVCVKSECMLWFKDVIKQQGWAMYRTK